MLKCLVFLSRFVFSFSVDATMSVSATPSARDRVVVFALTYGSYAGFHMVRKAVANVKHDLNGIGLSKRTLGTLDTLFLAAYAIGLYVSGSLADRFSVKRVLVIGTLLTALLTAMFGLVGFLGSHDDADERRYAILWCLNGFVQSVGWPSNVKIMGNWFGQGHRGAVFGFWASCVSVGNILGSLLASAVLHNGLGWEWVFLFPSIIIGVWALAIQCLLPSNPPPQTAATPPATTTTEATPTPTTAPKKPISFLAAWQIPGVAAFAATNGFTKMVAYSLLLWFPLYLSEQFDATGAAADLLSTLYDVGGVVGGIAFGVLSDWAFARGMGRSAVIMVMLFLSAVTLALFALIFESSLSGTAFLMTLTGLFSNAAYNLVNSVVAADLGSHPVLAGSTVAVSSVTGIIDGSGSVGAALGQPLVAVIVEATSWRGMFVFLAMSSILSAMCLIKVVADDAANFKRAQASASKGK
jgi:OPA family glycerol-3-phosphate transporter-like MFS transporter 3